MDRLPPGSAGGSPTVADSAQAYSRPAPDPRVHAGEFGASGRPPISCGHQRPPPGTSPAGRCGRTPGRATSPERPGGRWSGVRPAAAVHYQHQHVERADPVRAVPAADPGTPNSWSFADGTAELQLFRREGGRLRAVSMLCNHHHRGPGTGRFPDGCQVSVTGGQVVSAAGARHWSSRPISERPRSASW